MDERDVPPARRGPSKADRGTPAGNTGHDGHDLTATRRSNPVIQRWFCRCKEPPVLLGTSDASGQIHLKARDRYWHVRGSVIAVCPRCGCEHTLDPEARKDATVVLDPDDPH